MINEKTRGYQKKYREEHKEELSKKAKTKYDNNKEFRKNLLNANREYKRINYKTKNIETSVFEYCPVCGIMARFRVQYKYNNKINTKSNFALYMQHSNPLGTCFVSVKKYPMFKELLDKTKKETKK